MTKSKPAPAPAHVLRDEAVLCKHASSYPEVREDAPWGHRAFKVKGKTFLFMVADAEGLSLSTKLPESGPVALSLPFAEPTHYGLGKSGWVSAKFDPKAKVPLDLLREWIDESYRAIAPKKLLATLTAAVPSRPAPERARRAASTPKRKQTRRARPR
jgi:predicted DNA-binding protein (MmcQ/YjbR family)